MINFLRLLGIAISAVLMLGFGICGAWGIVGGVSTLNAGAIMIMGGSGALGLGLAYLCYRALRKLSRSGPGSTPERGE